ncbi:hypothetical protein BRPE64_CCDS04280 [Caballeronia insecticola]|uniref:Uncharacterized protein n=1 Tax=Caballeronia insecticola TaxID=758793 RepID=R4X245_9BURK|nr:hypothetical protein BRPE64_CCDS04280 [Caballeronia insecticola]
MFETIRKSTAASILRSKFLTRHHPELVPGWPRFLQHERR